MSGPLNHDVIIGAAARLFRVCVRLYPRRLRVEYGSEMETLFRRRMLSAAGIYALMSFTVAQRTREIGIRTALGASPRRLVMNVCGRAAWQVVAGVVVGSVVSTGAFVAIGVGVVRAMPLLLIVAAIMALVALLATFGPARRGVRIPAMEALRAEG